MKPNNAPTKTVRSALVALLSMTALLGAAGTGFADPGPAGIGPAVPVVPKVPDAEGAVQAVEDTIGIDLPTHRCQCCFEAPLTTGVAADVDPATGVAIDVGEPDPRWRVVSGPVPTVPGPAFGSAYVGWMTAPGGSSWITYKANGNTGSVGQYTYAVDFRLDTFCYTDFQIDIWFAVDNSVQFYLNSVAPSNLLGGGSGHTALSHLVASGSFVAGVNTLFAVVTNLHQGSPTGLLVIGDVSGVRQLNLDLSTGIGGQPPTQVSLAPGVADDQWTILSGPTGANGVNGPQPAFVVTPNGNWVNLQPGQWINHKGGTAYLDRKGAVSATVPYVYQVQFTVPRDCKWQETPMLNLRYSGDDNTQLLLDGNLIGSHTGYQTAGSVSVAVTPGTHTLQARVFNLQTETGLAVVGGVTAKADCECPPPVILFTDGKIYVVQGQNGGSNEVWIESNGIPGLQTDTTGGVPADTKIYP